MMNVSTRHWQHKKISTNFDKKKQNILGKPELVEKKEVPAL